MSVRMDDRDEFGNSRLHDLIAARPVPTTTPVQLLKLIPIVPWGYDPTNARRFS